MVKLQTVEPGCFFLVDTNSFVFLPDLLEIKGMLWSSTGRVLWRYQTIHCVCMQMFLFYTSTTNENLYMFDSSECFTISSTKPSAFSSASLDLQTAGGAGGEDHSFEFGAWCFIFRVNLCNMMYIDKKHPYFLIHLHIIAFIAGFVTRAIT